MRTSQESDLKQQQSWGASQPDLGESCTQDGFLCTPDFATPQDQQYDIAVDANDPSAVAIRSPAALSPNRIKRPRNAADFLEDGGSQPSQSQASQSDRGNGFSGLNNNAFPVPPSRKVLRKRYHSPPCLRNSFLHGTEDAAPALPKAPLPASRYRAEFKEIRLLGTGNFSKVHLAQHRLDGVNYAVKRSAHRVCSDAAKRQWVQEVHALAAVDSHPHLVRYHTAWIEKDAAADGEHLYIQLEACDTSLGNLRVLKSQAREAELVEIMRQISLALQHMHSRHMVHMDVKPDNIYVVGETTYKLGDLGLATSSNCNQQCSFEEGDARYIPAEILNGQLRDLPKADMFMLGITLYELTTCMDLPTGGQAYQNLRRGGLSLLPGFSTPYTNMLRKLMSSDPADRPTPEKVLASPLLAKKVQKEGKPQGAFGALNLQPSKVH